MSELYGDLPIKATGDFFSKLPKGITVTQVWIYFGKFLDEYYSKHSTDEKQIDNKVVKALIKSYDDQHHSGYSHLVVTQTIMEYLSGKMSEEEKIKIKKIRGQD